MAEIPTHVDVVVVGAGLAGHAAALAAAEAGVSVLLLEKEAAHGGSSTLAGGGLLFAGTELQREAGVPDSPERLREDLYSAGQHKNVPAVVESYVREQAETYRWLSAFGARFELSGAPVRRLHAMPPGQLTDLLHERVEEDRRTTYVADAPVVAVDQGTGGAVRVRVDGTAGPADVAARRGVVLASGGFSRSPELIARFAPHCSPAVPMGGSGSHGDGIRLALSCGAALTDMEFIEASYGASVLAGRGEPRLLYAQSDGAAILNKLGQRFVDEGSDIKALGRACAVQPDGLSFQVFDAAVMAASRAVPSTRDFASAYEDGLVARASSLTGLAGVLGIPAPALERSVEEHNERVRTGLRDGRVRPVVQAPFYGYPCRAGLTSTYGGISVDGDMRVQTADNHPVPGLFAAGEVVGGLHGAGYLVGSALGKAAVFGMVAGRNAAAGHSFGSGEGRA